MGPNLSSCLLTSDRYVLPGTFSFSPETQKLEGVAIDLDSRQLLISMVQQAARVVSAVVEIASNACNNGKHQLARSASFLAMPPPSLPIHCKQQALPLTFASFVELKSGGDAGLELLCNAAAGLPIVSPDLSGSSKPVLILRDFDLEADDEDVSNLSFDQCANIVDTCLFGGEINDSPERQPKRAKIEG